MDGLQGGFSSNGAVYYADSKELILRGWLMPCANYDSVEIYYNNTLLGAATIGIERKDVVKNFHGYSDDRPGFEFCGKDISFSKEDKAVLLVIKKGNELVDTRIAEIQVNSYEKKLTESIHKYSPQRFSCADTKCITEGRPAYLLVDEDADEGILCQCLEWDRITVIRRVDEIIEDRFIVVATCNWWATCKEIEARFQHIKPVKDYIPLWYLPVTQLNHCSIIDWDLKYTDIEYYMQFIQSTKKIAIVYGNCQARMVAEGLACSKVVNEDYVFVILPAVFEVGHEHLMKLRNVVKYADLFIYQYIKMTNKYSPLLGTDYLITVLKDECVKVCVPNVFFAGYYPQNCHNEYNRSKLVPTGDININRLYKNNALSGESLSLLERDNYYSKEFCENYCAESIEELRNREKKCDVVISDYVQANYKKRLLFLVNNHPVVEVVVELIQRIIYQVYGHRDEAYMWDNGIEELDWIQLPVYKSVIKNLELEFEQPQILPNRNHCKETVDWSGYVKWYLKECFNLE